MLASNTGWWRGALAYDPDFGGVSTMWRRVLKTDPSTVGWVVDGLETLETDDGLSFVRVMPEGSVVYRHIQSTASTVWTIYHNLGVKPNVICFDSSGGRMSGLVEDVSTNLCTVTFSVPLTGEAECQG